MKSELNMNIQTVGELDETSNKITLCVLRTQVGKTFTTINRISTEIEQDEEQGRSIHIVYTMNTLLSNKQFSKRLDMIEDTYGNGSVCIFASKYKGRYIHVSKRLELQGLCFNKGTCPRVIVMCSNRPRYTDGFEFIKSLNNQENINIYNNCQFYIEVSYYYHQMLLIYI